MSTTSKPQWRDIDGIVLLDKPPGMSSNHALQHVRRLFSARKAGHAGSLDPFATGMLPICFGKATRVNAYLLDSSKSYRVTALLGQATKTGDPEGDVIIEKPVPALSEASLLNVFEEFTGEIQQVPPMFSALKHQGKRLYELARAGIEVERQARPVSIDDIRLISIDGHKISFEVDCSKGTYIRTLVEDVAKQLDTVAHTIALRRLWVTPFDSQRATTLAQMRHLAGVTSEFDQALSKSEIADLKTNLHDYLLPIDCALTQLQELRLSTEDTIDLCHGRMVTSFADNSIGSYRLYGPNHQFLGIGEVRSGHGLKTQKLMVDPNVLIKQLSSCT